MRDYLTVVRALLEGETVTYEGPALSLRDASIAVGGLPRVPLYLGALGPQMVRLAGELADGALLNWATTERIAESRSLLNEGASRAGRDDADVSLTMYIRVCVDDDIAAARQALGIQVLNYAMAAPGIPLTAGYRGLFGAMGFDEALSELEGRANSGRTRACPGPGTSRRTPELRRLFRLSGRRSREPSPAYQKASTRPSCGLSPLAMVSARCLRPWRRSTPAASARQWQLATPARLANSLRLAAARGLPGGRCPMAGYPPPLA